MTNRERPGGETYVPGATLNWQGRHARAGTKNWKGRGLALLRLMACVAGWGGKRNEILKDGLNLSGKLS